MLTLALERARFDIRSGQRLGAYRLHALIGRGGTGDVYRAARADGAYEQQVAVKLMRGSLDREHAVARFRAERQIMASLDHPNLAKVYDGGVMEDGRPYLVMELVAGEPIDVYAQRNGLSIEQRLRLFRTVCQVVHYVHQQGVVHCDLTPGHILVTERGVIKLLDFGIARKIDVTDADGAAPSAGAAMPLTLAYASPEQVRGGRVAPTSDVYALGVVLYRLLTGVSPYLGVTPDDHYAWSAAVCEVDPPRPSQAVADRRLRADLQGDLDAVVMMALRKDPARRYASAEQLADDVFRHLERLPVQARRGAWSYRAHRFLLRHRAAAGVALVANLALLAGLGFAGYEVYEANRQRERAERHANGVRHLANVFIFDMHEAIRTLPGSSDARKLVVQTALTYLEQLGTERRDDPKLQIEIARAYLRVGDALGQPYNAAFGDLDAAARVYAKAQGLLEPLTRRALLDRGPRAAAQLELARVLMRQAILLEAKGRHTGALQLLQRALPAAHAAAAANPSDVRSQTLLAAVYGNLSSAYESAGDWPAYEKHLATARRLTETVLARHPEDRMAATNLAILRLEHGLRLLKHGSSGELARAAAQAAQEGLQMLEQLQRNDPHDTVVTRALALGHEYLGLALARLGQFEHAVRQQSMSLQLLEQQLDQTPHDTMLQAFFARTRAELAAVTLAQGDVEASIGIGREAVRQHEALPTSARGLRLVLYASAYADYHLAQALWRRNAQAEPGTIAIADRAQACTLYRRAQRSLQSADPLPPHGPGLVTPAMVQAALASCATAGAPVVSSLGP
ncbi:protein kinase domain-containing protein [Caldimonas brevitalea]|uniref:Serine/threonine protein kinase n=1 Tax=Caldimonas brevitalea TaxID=413882 RepID=A0A0G3BSU3_9BURK|nr:protein kinase [Caldimonas brevitalea]AKJ31078.1 serine/threonine protein kinase [Caldimonas brevitalea]